jgi:PII-like signaling protein
MVSEGLIEVQDTTVVKLARRPVEGSEPLPHERVEGKAVLLEVFLGEADRWHGEPLSEAIVKKLRMMEIAGATVSQGILGYGAKGHQHKRSFFHPMRDVPVVISVIDTPEKIAGAVEAIEAMMEDGLLVTREVMMTRLVRGRVGKEVSDATG